MKAKVCSRGDHNGIDAIRVGPYRLHLTGTMHRPNWAAIGAGIIVPLTQGRPPEGDHTVFEGFVLEDFGGVPDDWERRLTEIIIPALAGGDRMVAYCMGSHGRTGCFAASLIAILESEEHTPDPIAAIRERHCEHAVETTAQAEAIFVLRGQPLPEIYHGTFRR